MFHVGHKKIGEQSALPTNQNLNRYENSKIELCRWWESNPQFIATLLVSFH